MAKTNVTAPASEPISHSFIPANYYTDPDLPRREREGLWPRTWQVVCRVEELPKTGDFVSYAIADDSILVVRTSSDAIRAYYNVCQHRGRRLIEEPRGNARAGFFCRFHGWKYDLDGSLQHVADEEDWNCDAWKADSGLKGPTVDIWGGWVWINMDANAEPLLPYLGVVATTVVPLELDTMRRIWHKTIVAPVDWKVVVGAFSEGYHAGATHIGGLSYRTLKSLVVEHGPHSMYFSEWSHLTRVKQGDSWADVKDLREHIHANCAHLYRTLYAMVLGPTMRAADRLLAEVSADASALTVATEFFRFQREETEKTGAKWPTRLTLENSAQIGTGWHVFPNTIFLPTVDGALWYRVRPHPEDDRSCIFDIWSLGRFAPGAEPAVEQETYAGFDAFKGQNPFLEEDFENMVAVDKGMRSKGWTGANLNPRQELQIATFMRELAKYCNE